jgi:hypothetical protein
MHTLRITVSGLVLLSVFVFVAAQINQRKDRMPVANALVKSSVGKAV